MPLSLFKKIAQQTFQYTKSLWLSCNYEAFMAKDFLEIIQHIKNIPFSVLITNGTLLNEENILKIIDSGLSRLIISFDGASKETFEKIRRGANFATIISNIELINSLKAKTASLNPEVCFFVTLMRSNIEEISSIVRLAHSLKVGTIFCKPVQILFLDTKKEALDNFYELTISNFNQAQKLAEELRIKLEATPDLLKLLKKNEDPFENTRKKTIEKTNKIKKCGEIPPILFISPDGKVKPCTQWRGEAIGDFNYQNFWEIWEGNKFKKLRLEIESSDFGKSCFECRYLI